MLAGMADFSHSPHPDVVVIGAGVMGLCAAWSLAKAGLRVRVLGARQPGVASWAAGGILSPLPPWHASKTVWALTAESLRRYPAFIEELQARSGVDPEWRLSGLCVLAPDDPAAAQQWALRVGLPMGVGRIAQAGSGEDCLLLPWVAQVRPPRLLRALRLALPTLGVTLTEDDPVQALQHNADGRVASVLTQSGERLAAARFIASAGAWTSRLLPPDSRLPAVQPVKGQMLLLDAPAGVLPHILLRGGHYLIPRADGTALLGSTLEHTGFAAEPDTAGRNALLQAAEFLVAGASRWPVLHHWAGLRPMAGGQDPLLLRHPASDNLWLHTAHYRNGITLAPASANKLVDWMLQAA